MSAQQGPTIIVAMDSSNGIGKDNTLPWKLAEDMRHFRETTTGHVVVMGRRTFESIGKPLPNRVNIVLSRNGFQPPEHSGTLVTNELRHALSLASHAPEKRVFIIGGANLYQQALAIASELIVTHIPETYACDTFFPHISSAEWVRTDERKIPCQALGRELRIATYRRHEVAYHPV